MKVKKHPWKEWAKAVKNALCLNEWQLAFVTFDEDKEGNEGNMGPAACMGTQPQYMEMSLEIYPRFFELAETHQFEIIVHEFCHVLTDELYKTAVAFSQGKNYHQDSLEATRERNTTMTHLAVLSLMGNTELRKIYDKLSNIKHHNRK